MIRFQEVSKAFGSGAARIAALRGVTLNVSRGEMCAIMGPSGAGKSTLLHVALGLLSFDSGQITIGQYDISSLSRMELAVLRRRNVAFVSQSSDLISFLSAYDNVALPLRLDRVRASERNAKVARALERVGLRERLSHKPHQLSGGEMQRVAVARAVAISPEVILADEPTGNLDSAGGRQIMTLLREVNQETGVTVVVVTHDPVWASLCDRVVRMVDGLIEEDFSLGEQSKC